MANETRENSGVLFKNARKEKDNHPDYEGSIRVGGVDYWLKAWIKDGRNGKFMSLATTEKVERARQIRSETERNSYGDRFDENEAIPF